MRLNFFLLICFLFTGVGCKEYKAPESSRQIISEWMGKSVQFPSGIPCFIIDKEVECPQSKTPFKIVIYNDNQGCTSCKLRLGDWKELIAQADSLFPGKVSFHFYYYPQDSKELTSLLEKYNFTHPVHIDKKNTMDKKNKFPANPDYQCFLLDEENKVICTGNPAKSIRTWTLYKNKIRGTEEEKEPVTTIAANSSALEFGQLKLYEEKELTIQITNTGELPFIIKRITTSCGCTVAEWDKHPIPPGKQTTIQVNIKPDHTGFFNKYIDVYSNVDKGVIRFFVKGEII